MNTKKLLILPVLILASSFAYLATVRSEDPFAAVAKAQAKAAEDAKKASTLKTPKLTATSVKPPQSQPHISTQDIKIRSNIGTHQTEAMKKLTGPAKSDQERTLKALTTPKMSPTTKGKKQTEISRQKQMQNRANLRLNPLTKKHQANVKDVLYKK